MSEDEFKEFMEKVKPIFTRKYKKELPEGVAIDDFFQEVLIAFWKNIDKITGNRYHYFWRIASNLCKKAYGNKTKAGIFVRIEEDMGTIDFEKGLFNEKVLDEEMVTLLSNTIEEHLKPAEIEILLAIKNSDSLVLVHEDLVLTGVLKKETTVDSIYKMKERGIQKLKELLAKQGINYDSFFG